MKAYMIRNDLELDELKTWDRSMTDKYGSRMLEIAKIVSRWSKCPEGRQHGCIIAFKGKYIVSTGYNGPATGVAHCEDCGYDDDKSTCPAIHAEVNAIINMTRLGISSFQAVAYITKTPCKHCRSVLLNAGITTVVVDEILSGNEPKKPWKA